MDQPVTVAEIPLQQADIPEHILEESQKHNYFIYNVGPWAYNQPTGSMGSKYIPALEESMCLAPEHRVAGPLVISGQPYETYPGDGHQRIIWHKSRAHGRNRKEWEGFDFAQNVCGVGHGLPLGQNLLLRGVFISKIADAFDGGSSARGEQLTGYRAPAKPESKGSALDRYNAFLAEVIEAERALKKHCAEICVEANGWYNSKQFEAHRSDNLFQAFRIIKGTTAEFPWAAGTGDSMLANTACGFCGSTIKGGVAKCPVCHEQLITNAEMEARRAVARGDAAKA